jgi:tellurite resistance protein
VPPSSRPWRPHAIQLALPRITGQRRLPWWLAAQTDSGTHGESEAMPRARLTPNLFGIAFGLAGLAQCWTTAHETAGVPLAIGDTLWLVVAAVWCVVAFLYVRDLVRAGRLRTELRDPTFAPFTALAPIVAMLFGVDLAAHSRSAGVAVFAVALVLTVGVGGWLSGEWILSDISLAQWHPGYFLPTVAGGFLAASSSAQLGYHSIALLMFGYGAICWVVLGSILLARLFTQPLLPTPLRPTMAIEMAPPVVAGIAWFAINGNRVDAVALGLAGYALLMVLVQLRLIEVYRTVPFGVGWWAYAFSCAAVFVDALRWLSAEHSPHARDWAWALLAVVSTAAAGLVARTSVALAHGSFLPRPLVQSPLRPVPEKG